LDFQHGFRLQLDVCITEVVILVAPILDLLFKPTDFGALILYLCSEFFSDLGRFICLCLTLVEKVLNNFQSGAAAKRSKEGNPTRVKGHVF
jgi:hypothetical protein